MGGPGSGTWHRKDARTTVETCWPLTSTALAPVLRRVAAGAAARIAGSRAWAQGASVDCLVERYDEAVVLRLSYTRTSDNGESATYDYAIAMTSTPANLPGNAGRRWWFRCPIVANGQPCGRRVGRLYLPPGGVYFGCRTCCNLTYQSSNTSHRYDAMLHRIGFDSEAARVLDREWLEKMLLNDRSIQASRQTSHQLDRLQREWGLLPPA